MSGQCKCGSRAINDDPHSVLCDNCLRDSEIERLLGEVRALKQKSHSDYLERTDIRNRLNECRRERRAMQALRDNDIQDIERLRAERIDLVRWMLDRIEDGWHGCVTGDCPHEQASDCIDSLLECFDVDMAARAAGGEG